MHTHTNCLPSVSYCVCLVVTNKDLILSRIQSWTVDILTVRTNSDRACTHTSSDCACTHTCNETDGNLSFGLPKAYVSIFGSISSSVDEILPCQIFLQFLDGRTDGRTERLTNGHILRQHSA